MYEVSTPGPNYRHPKSRAKTIAVLFLVALIGLGLGGFSASTLITRAGTEFTQTEAVVRQQAPDTTQRTRRSVQHLRTMYVEAVDPAAWGGGTRKLVSADARTGDRLPVWFSAESNRVTVEHPNSGSVGEWSLAAGFGLVGALCLFFGIRMFVKRPRRVRLNL